MSVSSDGSAEVDAAKLQEFEPQNHILGMIPARAQRGLFASDMELTCLDVTKEYVALGTNIGLVFMYDRMRQLLQRLSCKNRNDTITCISMQSSLEYVVAMGTSSGLLCIFQLPSILPGRTKQLQMFTVRDMHKSAISCLQWSQNTMKLYSGDNSGLVLCTEIDYNKNSSESYFVIQELHRVVQLSYTCKTLLVSTLQKSILISTDTPGQVCQVGTKERKSLGDYGASFIPDMCKPSDVQLYATRPGLRLWKAHISGSVMSTYIYKDLLKQSDSIIQLLPDAVPNSDGRGVDDKQFGTVHYFSEAGLVLTYSDTALFLLNPVDGSVVGYHGNLGNMISVVASENEIFILRRCSRRDRPLIRLGVQPDALLSLERLQYMERFNKTIMDSEESRTDADSQDLPADGSNRSPLHLLSGSIRDKLKLVGEHLANNSSPSEKSSDVHENLEDLHTHTFIPPVTGLSALSFLSNIKFANPPTEKKPDAASDQNASASVLPPVVKLESDDLLSVTVLGELPTKTITEATSSDHTSKENELHSPTSVNTDKSTPENGSVSTASECFESCPESPETTPRDITDVGVTREGRFESIAMSEPQGKYDVVFKSKQKKNKKKKQRSGKEKETDSDSVASMELDGGSAMQNSQSSDSTTSPLVTAENSNHEISVEREEAAVTAYSSVGQLDAEDRSVTEINKSPTIKTEVDQLSLGSDKQTESKEKPQTCNYIGSKVTETEKAAPPMPSESATPPVKTDIKQQTQISDGNVKYDTQKPVKTDVKHGREKSDVRIMQGKKADHHLKQDQNKPDLEISSHPRSENQKTELDKKNVATTKTVTTKSEQVFVHPVDTVAKQPNLPGLAIKSGTPKTLPNKTASSIVSKTETTASKTAEIHPSQQNISRGRDGVLKGDKHSTQTNVPSARELTLSKEGTSNVQKRDVNSGAGLKPVSLESTPLSGGPFMDKEPVSPTESMSSIYRSQDSSGEDIYTKYRSTSSATSPESTLKTEPSLEENLDYSVVQEKLEQKTKQVKEYDSWSEFLAPGYLQSLCVSDRYVWCVDRNERLYYSNLVGPGLQWKKVDEAAKQIAVSPSGVIVWRLYRNSIYAGVNISARLPHGKRWVEVARDVAYITVDDNMAWYIKVNGDVLLQTGLSRERPCYRSYKVPCPFRLIQICCYHGVVWGLTEDRKVIIRHGVDVGCPEGTGWKYMEGNGHELLGSCISLGDRSTGWLVDVVGRVWFSKNVTMATPGGDGKWFQISLSEYLMQDATALDTLRQVTEETISRMMQWDKLQCALITAGRNGLWVCPGCRNVIHVCRGSLTGQSWEKGIPVGMALSTRWSSVVATTSDISLGSVWAQSQGELIVISATSLRATPIELPDPNSAKPLVSVTEEAVWALLSDGRVYIRTGIRPNSPQGVSWVRLDLQQLGRAKIVHISCSTQNVWAVDNKGYVYLRIGVKAPSTSYLNPAWVPVDGSPNNSAIFTSIFTGPSDSMVWALDNRNCVYVRQGVTESMPIGTEWIYVPGTPAIDMCVSNTTVYAVNLSGEILQRFGVSEDNVSGDYWKKIPGVCSNISVSGSDELWAIDNEEHLVRRQIHLLSRPQVLHDLATNRGSLDLADDWEMI